MASLRRKPQSQTNGGNEPPPDHSRGQAVMSPPAAEPAPAVEPKPVEPIVESSPAEETGKNQLREQLRKMEIAVALQRQQQQPQPQRAAESEAPPPVGAEGRQQPQEPTLEQMIAHLPPRVQRWYSAHPEFLTDPEKAAQIQYCHHVARRETGEEMTEPYFDRMESMLGIAPATHAETKPTPQPNVAPALHSAPQRQPARPMAGTTVSAPPSRDVPSYSTGRSPRHRVPLTRDELEIAAASGQTPEQYQAQKEKMLRMKANNEIQNG